MFNFKIVFGVFVSSVISLESAIKVRPIAFFTPNRLTLISDLQNSTNQTAYLRELQFTQNDKVLNWYSYDNQQYQLNQKDVSCFWIVFG